MSDLEQKQQPGDGAATTGAEPPSDPDRWDASEAPPPTFTYDETSANLPPAESTEEAELRDDNEGGGGGGGRQISSKQLSAQRLARISQARKLRKTRLSLGNFITQQQQPAAAAALTNAAEQLSSGNSSESVSSFGSVPSEFDDLCNNS